MSIRNCVHIREALTARRLHVKRPRASDKIPLGKNDVYIRHKAPMEPGWKFNRIKKVPKNLPKSQIGKDT